MFCLEAAARFHNKADAGMQFPALSWRSPELITYNWGKKAEIDALLCSGRRHAKGLSAKLGRERAKLILTSTIAAPGPIRSWGGGCCSRDRGPWRHRHHIAGRCPETCELGATKAKRPCSCAVREETRNPAPQEVLARSQKVGCMERRTGKLTSPSVK